MSSLLPVVNPSSTSSSTHLSSSTPPLPLSSTSLLPSSSSPPPPLSSVFAPLLKLSPPPSDRDYTYNLEDSEGISDLYDVGVLQT